MMSEVHQAILEVMKRIGYVQKDGQIKAGGRYSYASETAFLQSLRPEMLDVGLVMFPHGLLKVSTETYKTSSGATMNLVTVRRGFKIVHVPSGSSEFVNAIGQGADTGDKAAGKAMTNALKYALRQLFLIETGDDPDHTPSVEQERLSEEKATHNFPSPNMTSDEKYAWVNFVRQRMEDGLKQADAEAEADEAFYDYLERSK